MRRSRFSRVALLALFLSFTFFSVLFVIGCQENSITDPISIEPINKVQTAGETVITGSIPLDGKLVVPGGNSYYTIDGSISYTHELVLLDPIPPAPQYNIQLNLAVDAVLNNPDLPGRSTWAISSESEDVFYVSEEGIYILDKYFPVQHRNDGMVLVCRFLVTTDGVGLNAMWLSFTDDNRINKSGRTGDPLTILR